MSLERQLLVAPRFLDKRMLTARTGRSRPPERNLSPHRCDNHKCESNLDRDSIRPSVRPTQAKPAGGVMDEVNPGPRLWLGRPLKQQIGKRARKNCQRGNYEESSIPTEPSRSYAESCRGKEGGDRSSDTGDRQIETVRVIWIRREVSVPERIPAANCKEDGEREERSSGHKPNHLRHANALSDAPVFGNVPRAFEDTKRTTGPGGPTSVSQRERGRSSRSSSACAARSSPWPGCWVAK
jgi:hypothetical protein